MSGDGSVALAMGRGEESPPVARQHPRISARPCASGSLPDGERIQLVAGRATSSSTVHRSGSRSTVRCAGWLPTQTGSLAQVDEGIDPSTPSGRCSIDGVPPAGIRRRRYRTAGSCGLPRLAAASTPPCDCRSSGNPLQGSGGRRGGIGRRTRFIPILRRALARERIVRLPAVDQRRRVIAGSGVCPAGAGARRRGLTPGRRV
jgi:hypothetical protein